MYLSSNKKVSQIFKYVKLLRLKHWFKSVFVIVGFFFSGLWVLHYQNVFLVCVAFCFASSVVYIINDFADLSFDRQHPIKKHRPLASGLINAEIALILMFVLMVLSLAICSLVSNKAIFIVISYLLINVAYSYKLKHIAYLDILCISTGFMLRILMGTWAIGIIPSKWLIICGTMLSIFLAFSKRYLEIKLVSADRFRPVLSKYSAKMLAKLLFISGTFSFISYIFYVYSMTQHFDKPYGLSLTIPFAVIGFVRYSAILIKEKYITCPINLFLKDRFSITNLAIFAIIVFFTVQT